MYESTAVKNAMGLISDVRLIAIVRTSTAATAMTGLSDQDTVVAIQHVPLAREQRQNLHHVPQLQQVPHAHSDSAFDSTNDGSGGSPSAASPALWPSQPPPVVVGLQDEGMLPAALHVSVFEATIESPYTVIVPRLLLPLILQRRQRQLGFARVSLARYLQVRTLMAAHVRLLSSCKKHPPSLTPRLVRMSILAGVKQHACAQARSRWDTGCAES